MLAHSLRLGRLADLPKDEAKPRGDSEVYHLYATARYTPG
jgi:hypothetical protein